MIILKLNWLLHQTETEIAYLGKLISDIFQTVDRGHNPRNRFYHIVGEILLSPFGGEILCSPFCR